MLATDATLCNRFEIYIKYVVIDSLATMWTLSIVITEPRPADVVELRTTETGEVIQAFALECTDKALTERIGLWRPNRSLDDLDSFRFLKRFHVFRIDQITVTKEEASIKTLFV